jgi:hypothetical protein
MGAGGEGGLTKILIGQRRYYQGINFTVFQIRIGFLLIRIWIRIQAKILMRLRIQIIEKNVKGQ